MERMGEGGGQAVQPRMSSQHHLKKISIESNDAPESSCYFFLFFFNLRSLT